MAGSSRWKMMTVLGLALVAVLLLGWWWMKPKVVPSPPMSELLRNAQNAIAEEDYESVEKFCQQALAKDPESVPVLLLAGEAAMKAERFEDALKYFRTIPRTASDDSIIAMFAAGEVSRALGHFSDAERDYREVLKHRPLHVVAHERLAFVLDLQGRRWESITHLLALVRQDRISFSSLIRLGSRDSAIPYPKELAKVRRANHDPAAVKLADAVDAMAHFQLEKAERLLNEALQLKPDFMEAHARLGRLLADQKISQIPDWQRKLPPQAESHPDVWIARGLWSQYDGQTQAAIRCFLEAAARDPNQRVAHYQLSQLLKKPEFAAARARFAERSRLLQKLAAVMSQLSLNRDDGAAMQSASQLLAKLGRYWEAYGWCGMVLVKDPTQIDTRKQMQGYRKRLSPTLPLTETSANPVTMLDISAFPLPQWPVTNGKSHPVPPSTNPQPKFRFVDHATQTGLKFTYFNGHNPAKVGTLMHEFSGGGIGVLDYDGDGFPDLYLTQGCPFPSQTESTLHRDRLFRNLGNGRFEDVTEQAGLGDGWFSQGIAVGDIDNDGFPDLYLANIGRNRLYHNNGDGTFEDISDTVGMTGKQWTTSCLLADLDGDRCPDIYDVNYLKGDDIFTRLCLIGGQRRACAPSTFTAERDRILISSQDGKFRELVEKEATPLNPPRAGLGIIAADMDSSGRLSLFVANDVVANSFLVNKTAAKGGPLDFRENALLAGLAFDSNGRAQACMGVAANDVDGNGLLDLFVTNYYEEGNSLYLQTAPGVFVESSRQSGLFNPSLRQLGFGTQFLDADLDGSLDLIVANGHLDDFQYLNTPYRMKPQFFHNRGVARFQEAASKTVGDYFDRKLLGRSMAVLDWNRDGRPDFVVSHLETPVALVTNETRTVGQWLKIRLAGVQSSRDAFGTTITLQCGKKKRTHQLTAGSGYQASNERMLLFGLGECKTINRLTVRWPSGLTQTFENIKPNKEWLITEGGDKPLMLPNR